MPNVKTTCSIVEPWPGLDDRGISFCILAGRTRRRRRARKMSSGVQLRVARPAGGVDDRDVELLDDLAVGEEQRRLHPEVAPARGSWGCLRCFWPRRRRGLRPGPARASPVDRRGRPQSGRVSPADAARRDRRRSACRPAIVRQRCAPTPRGRRRPPRRGSSPRLRRRSAATSSVGHVLSGRSGRTPALERLARPRRPGRARSRGVRLARRAPEPRGSRQVAGSATAATTGRRG